MGANDKSGNPFDDAGITGIRRASPPTNLAHFAYRCHVLLPMSVDTVYEKMEWKTTTGFYRKDSDRVYFKCFVLDYRVNRDGDAWWSAPKTYLVGSETNPVLDLRVKCHKCNAPCVVVGGMQSTHRSDPNGFMCSRYGSNGGCDAYNTFAEGMMNIPSAPLDK